MRLASLRRADRLRAYSLNRVYMNPQVYYLMTRCLQCDSIPVEGKVYTWGASNNGALGMGDSVLSVPRPDKEVCVPHFCLSSTSRTHLLLLKLSCVFRIALSISNLTYSFIRIFKHCEMNLPQVQGMLSGKVVSKVSCGCDDTFAVTQCGGVYAWGSGCSLGLGAMGAAESKNVPTFMGGPLSGKKVVDVSCGGTYSLALCDDGKVIDSDD